MKMRWSVLLGGILFALNLNAGNMDLKLLRDLYYKASVSKNDAEIFLKTMEKLSAGGDPLISGYLGMAYMIKANHAINPYNKLSYFIKGKNLLDGAISSSPLLAELRFLRYSVQTNAPAFLNYRGNKGDDKKQLIQSLNTLQDSDLYTRIKEFLLNSTETTASEKELIR